MLKRNRPNFEPMETEEAGLPSQPRISEACSDSSCDSGAMEVQRIHSGLPVLPEVWKTDGAGTAVEGPSCPSRRSDDNHGRIEPVHAVRDPARRFGLPLCGGRRSEAFHICSPQSLTADAHTITLECNQLPCGSVGRCTSALEEQTVVCRKLQRAIVFTSLSKDALQQQIHFLEEDEKALLVELRALRREYDARVAASQPQPITGCSLPSQANLQSLHQPDPKIIASFPDRHAASLPIKQLALFGSHRRSMDAAGRPSNLLHLTLNLDEPSDAVIPGAEKAAPAPSPTPAPDFSDALPPTVANPNLNSCPGGPSGVGGGSAPRSIIRQRHGMPLSREVARGPMPPPPPPPPASLPLQARWTATGATKGGRREGGAVGVNRPMAAGLGRQPTEAQPGGPQASVAAGPAGAAPVPATAPHVRGGSFGGGSSYMDGFQANAAAAATAVEQPTLAEPLLLQSGLVAADSSGDETPLMQSLLAQLLLLQQQQQQ